MSAMASSIAMCSDTHTGLPVITVFTASSGDVWSCAMTRITRSRSVIMPTGVLASTTISDPTLYWAMRLATACTVSSECAVTTRRVQTVLTVIMSPFPQSFSLPHASIPPLRAQIGTPIHTSDEDGTTYEVPQGDGHEVAQYPHNERRITKAVQDKCIRKKEHVGNGVLQPDGHKRRDGQDDRQYLVRHCAASHGQPNGETDQGITEHAQVTASVKPSAALRWPM